MRRTIRAAMLAGILLISGVGISAQQEEQAIEDRLVAFTHQLRMSLTLATVAAHSPTIIDLHLHAQQLVNLLEGVDGRHFVRPVAPSEQSGGLLTELTAMRTRFETASLANESRTLVITSAKNIRIYFDFALSAALDGLGQRRRDLAVADMLRAYAFLLAAYEKPCDAAYIPALWTILRAYGLTSSIGTGDSN